jgi:hypothetical protein
LIGENFESGGSLVVEDEKVASKTPQKLTSSSNTQTFTFRHFIPFTATDCYISI